MITPANAGLTLAALPAPSSAPSSAGHSAAAPGFSDRLAGAFEELGAAQARARQSATAWEQGLQQDLAAVMIDQQVASLGFQLALNVRNKALGAYRDIISMPV